MNTKKIEKPDGNATTFGELEDGKLFTLKAANKEELYIKMADRAYTYEGNYLANINKDKVVIICDMHPIEWWEK